VAGGAQHWAAVKELGVGLFGSKATCLTCNEVVSNPSHHVFEKHLLSVEGQFSYDCPCGQSAGKWDTVESALAARMGHMEKVHPASKIPHRALHGFK
jgi:hypothetical protein